MKRILMIIAILSIGAFNLIAQSSSIVHTVQRGETLASIANAYGITEKQIIEANPDAAQFIYVGMELNIPVPDNSDSNINKDIPYNDNKENIPINNKDAAHNNIKPIGLYNPSESINLFFAIQGGFGYSNFIWNEGSVNGDMSYSADIVGQLYFPQNWYMELALGWDKRGASKFSINYGHARIYPLGYRISASHTNFVLKGGVNLGLPFSKLKTNSNSWNSNFQIGIGGGFQIELNQFAIGCNLEYDFTKVSSSCGQALNNIAVLGTFSYKFTKIGF